MSRRSAGPGISFFAFQDIITAVVGIFILITLLLVLELAQRVEASSSSPTADVTAVRETIASLAGEVQRMDSELARRRKMQNETADLNAFNRQEKWEQITATAQAAQQQIDLLESTAQQTRDRLTDAEKRAAILVMDSAALEDDRSLLEQLKDKLGQVQEAINRLEGDDSPIFRDETEQGRFIALVIFEDKTIELRDALARSTQSWQGPRRLNELRTWLTATDLSKRQLFLVIKPGSAGDFEAIQKDLDRMNAVYGYNVAGEDERIRLGFEAEGLP